MIKGVNKQILELADTGSEYFEKAMLIVDANQEISQQELYEAAERLFQPAREPENNADRWKIIALMAAFAALGSVVTLFISKLL